MSNETKSKDGVKFGPLGPPQHLNEKLDALVSKTQQWTPGPSQPAEQCYAYKPVNKRHSRHQSVPVPIVRLFMNDDLTIRQAADTVYDLLRQFLTEPNETNRATLIGVMKHYIVQGYRFKLTQNAVIVTFSDAQRHLSGSRADHVSGGVNA